MFETISEIILESFWICSLKNDNVVSQFILIIKNITFFVRQFKPCIHLNVTIKNRPIVFLIKTFQNGFQEKLLNGVIYLFHKWILGTIEYLNRRSLLMMPILCLNLDILDHSGFFWHLFYKTSKILFFRKSKSFATCVLSGRIVAQPFPNLKPLEF